VLFVLGFPFNLISISKLTRSLNCSITFTSGSLCIQDQSTGNTIGAGSEQQGLYYLQSPSSTVCNVSASPDIIHRRLGHPSLDKLKVLVPQLTFKVSSVSHVSLANMFEHLFIAVPVKDPGMPLILCILIFGVLAVCPLI